MTLTEQKSLLCVSGGYVCFYNTENGSILKQVHINLQEIESRILSIYYSEAIAVQNLVISSEKGKLFYLCDDSSTFVEV